MRTRDPINATHLAVELYASRGSNGATPSRCAKIATDLCALGRRSKALAERLSGGEEDWGSHASGAEKRMAAAEKRWRRINAQIDDLLKPWGSRAVADRSGGGVVTVVHFSCAAVRTDTALL